MPTNKSLKVDEAVHAELERLKNEYEVDSFNDVLRHELGIIPDAKVDELAAFLPEELRNVAHDVVEVIDSKSEFSKEVVEGGPGKNGQQITYLTFTDPGTDREIVRVGFEEHEFIVEYRDKDGEFSQIGRGRKSHSTGEISYGTTGGTYDHIDREEVLDAVEEKVAGSLRRWGAKG